MPKSSTLTSQPTEPSLRLRDILEEEYNHIHETNQNKGDDTFILINPDKLLATLTAEHTEAQQRALYRETPYTRLAEWLAAAAPGKPFTKELVRQVLKDKAKETTLLTTETWLQDVALRPYTRGLLKRYLAGGKTPDSGEPAPETSELNQLLLEDAFADHIQPKDNTTLDGIFSKMLSQHQTALCLSGGGIRSATFALGIIQGLAQHNLLGRFSYLSTVSGGGYIGGWLSAWSHHEGFDQVVGKLKTNSNIPIATEADPVHHLRQYSNYLTPQLGLFSADTWTLGATYLRNLLLIWLVLLPFLAALTAAPLLAVSLADYKVDFSNPLSLALVGGMLLLVVVLTVLAVRFVHAYIPAPDPVPSQAKSLADRPHQSARDQVAFINSCLVPFSVAVLALILIWQWVRQLDSTLPLWAATLYDSLGLGQAKGLTIWSKGGLYIMIGTASTHVMGWLLAIPSRKKPVLQVLMFLVIAAIGAFAGFLMLLTAKLLQYESVDVNTCLGFPCFLLAVILTGYLFEGIISRFIPDSRREWTARYTAWLLIVAFGWLFLTSIVLLGPGLISQIKLEIAGLGLGSGILTALLGSSTKTAGPGQGAGSRHGKGSASGIIGILSTYTLPIVATLTLLTLLVLLSLFDRLLIELLNDQLASSVDSKPLLRTLTAVTPLFVLGLLAAIGYLIASAVDTNQFSLHAMYSARLIRAYLGASRPPSVRQPDPFTGFDEADNIPMGDLSRQPEQTTNQPPAAPKGKAPFHIINIALNLVSGQNLAWQERKAEAFSVSPLHAGSLSLGYRRTTRTSDDTTTTQQATNTVAGGSQPYVYGGDKGISLGTAMTISGAAASPNMGYHSSPMIAFLMTLFNVRLGWWLGNPGPAGDKTFYQSKPALAVKPIWDELLGKTDDLNEYVYLSDGGHFENLGLYEMVLRRNRFIVVSDASCDEKCTLEDLGNAIRKIRIDLGIPIDFADKFDVRARSHKVPATDGKYWALGRIRYSAVDKRTNGPTGEADETDGLLLYIKPGFYGTEPRDVFNYATTQSAFPHESTADQFFSESQFESYRILGKHVLDTIVHSFPTEVGISLDKLFDPDGPKTYWQLPKR